ncbi:L-rhamnose mutarotase [Nocardioides speluncae]|uniref:L-rhamnose mutarotase n=1 Tax=Nocardioides speluncae TaxID=2670337 RepID=UPI000D687C8F|nr:L-rhamnose mutarotase [Nocardioides speluncae]
MPQIALHTVLKAGREGEYDAVHEVIPQDVATALRAHGVHDWRIWRSGRDVFHLVDVDDYARMREGLRGLPANLAWQETVAPFFERADDYSGDDAGLPFLWSLVGQLDSKQSETGK